MHTCLSALVCVCLVIPMSSSQPLGRCMLSLSELHLHARSVLSMLTVAGLVTPLLHPTDSSSTSSSSSSSAASTHHQDVGRGGGGGGWGDRRDRGDDDGPVDQPSSSSSLQPAFAHDIPPSVIDIDVLQDLIFRLYQKQRKLPPSDILHHLSSHKSKLFTAVSLYRQTQAEACAYLCSMKEVQAAVRAMSEDYSTCVHRQVKKLTTHKSSMMSILEANEETKRNS